MAEVVGRSSSGGIGISGLLTVAFVVLKLCHVINWSWLWVLSPLWIGTALFVAVVVVGLLGVLVVNAVGGRSGR